MTKTDFDNTVSSLNMEIEVDKTKMVSIENELKMLRTFDLSYFRGKSHFEEDGTQNYLMFQPISRYIKLVANELYVSSWISKGLSVETIAPLVTSDKSLKPLNDYVGDKIRLKYNESCLKQPKLYCNHGTVVNICIAYGLGASGSNDSDPTLKNCLFGAITLGKNTDFDKYRYSGCEIGFDRRSSFSFPGGRFGQNVLIFGAHMSSSAHIDNKKKDMLVLGIEPTQGLEHTLTAEKIYSINFTLTRKKFCLSFHYNEVNSYLFVNGTEMYKFKAKDSKIVATPLSLRNISNDWSVDSMKKTGFNGYV